jgi:hypothetical protein
MNSTSSEVTVPCGAGDFMQNAYGHSITIALTGASQDLLDNLDNTSASYTRGTTGQNRAAGFVTFANVFAQATINCMTHTVPASSVKFRIQ